MVRPAESHPGDGRLVRSPDFVPQTDCSFKVATRVSRIALGEVKAAARRRGAGSERLTLEDGGHFLQLVYRPAGSREVASRNRDLHLSVEKRCPSQLRIGWQLLRRDGRRMVERIADGGRRQRHFSPGQMHQSKSRLRIPPNLVSLEERLVRSLDVTPTKPNSPELGQGPAELSSQIRTQLFTGQQRLLLRIAG